MPVVSGTVARIVGRHIYLQGKEGGYYLPFGSTTITIGGAKGRSGRLTDVAPGDSAELTVKGNAPTRTVSQTGTHGDTSSVTVDKANFIKAT
jgi:hypothetical protein